MDWINRLAERWMLKAGAEGKLQGLVGEGRPLPDRTGEAFIPAGEAAGFRIMAAAGVVPEEITLKKQVIGQRAIVAGMSPEDPARRAEMAKLAELELRQSIAEEARRKFMR